MLPGNHNKRECRGHMAIWFTLQCSKLQLNLANCLTKLSVSPSQWRQCTENNYNNRMKRWSNIAVKKNTQTKRSNKNRERVKERGRERSQTEREAKQQLFCWPNANLPIWLEFKQISLTFHWPTGVFVDFSQLSRRHTFIYLHFPAIKALARSLSALSALCHTFCDGHKKKPAIRTCVCF